MKTQNNKDIDTIPTQVPFKTWTDFSDILFNSLAAKSHNLNVKIDLYAKFISRSMFVQCQQKKKVWMNSLTQLEKNKSGLFKFCKPNRFIKG